LQDFSEHIIRTWGSQDWEVAQKWQAKPATFFKKNILYKVDALDA
jgi:hypothetical protein